MTTPRTLPAVFRRTGFSLLRSLHFFITLAACSLVLHAADAPRKSFNLPEDAAEKSLKRFSEQSGVEVLFPTAAVKGVRTNAVSGEMTPQEALDAMLARTPLVGVQDEKTGSLTVRREASVEKAEKNASSRPANDRAADDKVEGTIKLETFEVMGTKLLNMDKPRTRDDAQPYVVFDRAAIARSGAVDLNQFLRQRLTMNTVSSSPAETAAQGNRSQINLRGLGENQTLILVDGHRMAGYTFQVTVGQSDINGIPLDAIERVEVLPTTASGIYGGNAVGGVINIVLRRDYQGSEIKVTYDNTFDTDSAIRRVDFSTGFTLEHGKTQVLLAGSYSSANQFLMRDRDFYGLGRKRAFANNPASFASPVPPPLGATPNIRSTSTNLVLDNGTPLNALFTYIPVGYAGTAADGGAALVANAGKYNLDLANSALDTGGGGRALVTNPDVKSLTVTVRRTFSSWLNAFLELSGTDNQGHFPRNQLSGFTTFTLPAAAPNNPFQQAVQVTIPYAASDGQYFSENNARRVVAGVNFRLPKQWQGEADYTWSRYSTRLTTTTGSSISAAGNTAITSGTVDIMRDTIAFPPDLLQFLPPGGVIGPFTNTLKDATLRLAGPVWELPGGPIALNGFAEHREENFADAYAVSDGTNRLFPGRSQKIDSAVLETTVPVVGERQHVPLLQGLDLQASVRWDDYRVTGATSFVSAPVGAALPLSTITHSSGTSIATSYTTGLKWKLNQNIALRASYGTGFLPPNVNQLQPTINATVTVTDPRRGNSPTPLSGAAGTYIEGGNPALRPEHSKSWSSGLVFTPEIAPGLRLSIDYTRIDYRDKISTFPGGRQAVVNAEALFPDRITRGPNLAGDPPDWAGPIIFLNNTLFNIARVRVEAWDLQADYQWKTSTVGDFNFFALLTWQPHYQTQSAINQPTFENIGYTSANPLEYKASTGFTWTRRHWTLGWNGAFYDSYHVYRATDSATAAATAILTQGAKKIPSQFYQDIFATYRFDRIGATGWRNRLTSGLEITAGIRNVFNREPPFDTTNLDRYVSPYADPRLASYYLSVRKTF